MGLKQESDSCSVFESSRHFIFAAGEMSIRYLSVITSDQQRKEKMEPVLKQSSKLHLVILCLIQTYLVLSGDSVLSFYIWIIQIFTESRVRAL